MTAAITLAMETLRAAAARYRLGWESGESLRALGVELLSNGHDEAVRLAVQDARTPRELSMLDVGPVFEQLCEDFGVRIPDIDEASEIVIAAILRDIVSKSVAPEAGLHELIDDVYYPHLSGRRVDVKYVGDSHGLQDFVSAYYWYEELHNPWRSFDGRSREDAIRLQDEEVRQLASEWLAAHPGIPPS
jgi:hypothetical protein